MALPILSSVLAMAAMSDEPLGSSPVVPYCDVESVLRDIETMVQGNPVDWLVQEVSDRGKADYLRDRMVGALQGFLDEGEHLETTVACLLLFNPGWNVCGCFAMLECAALHYHAHRNPSPDPLEKGLPHPGDGSYSQDAGGR